MKYITREIENEILDLSASGKPDFFKSAFTPFYTWKDLENTLNLRPLMTSSNFVVCQEIPRYEWKNSPWVKNPASIPPTFVQQIIEQAHCYFIDATRFNEAINSFSEELELIYGHYTSVDAHIYFNVTENLKGGFDIHCDYPDNLILQMEGRTKFEVWDKNVFPVTEEIGRSQILDLPIEPTLVVELEPGDTIFVPKDTYHRATNLTKRMSISFPIERIEKDNPMYDSDPIDRKWIKLDV